jgi:hypothetical protein
MSACSTSAGACTPTSTPRPPLLAEIRERLLDVGAASGAGWHEHAVVSDEVSAGRGHEGGELGQQLVRRHGDEAPATGDVEAHATVVDGGDGLEG